MLVQQQLSALGELLREPALATVQLQTFNPTDGTTSVKTHFKYLHCSSGIFHSLTAKWGRHSKPPTSLYCSSWSESYVSALSHMPDPWIHTDFMQLIRHAQHILLTIQIPVVENWHNPVALCHASLFSSLAFYGLTGESTPRFPFFSPTPTPSLL